MNTALIERTALPAWVYRQPSLLALEWEHVLKPSWQIACHVNTIPNAGDYITFTLGSDPIVVLRDREGTIRAFHNVCRHRGARLLDGKGHCAGTVVCPYHGWSYRLDGTLAGVSARDTFGSLQRSTLGLTPVKCDIAFGLVFVAVSGDPTPIGDMLAPLAAELAPYQMEQMQPLGAIAEERWNANWKLVMDNYLESYHVPIGHPGLARMFTPDYEDQAHCPGVARGTSWLRETPSSRWSERMYQRDIESVATHLPVPARRCWRFYSVLPNLGIDIYPDQMDFFQVLPDGHDRTLIRSAVFALKDERRSMRVIRQLTARINRGVNREDRDLCERVQAGLGSSSYVPGPLSGIECWMGEFHDLLRSRIPQIALPTPPPSA